MTSEKTHTPVSAACEASTLDHLLDEAARRSGPPARATAEGGVMLVGECVDDCHPSLVGRVRVRWHDGEHSHERWVPTLQALPVRTGDHVLLSRPVNWPEPLVIGVVDGFARRPENNRTRAGALELRRDESVRIAGTDGAALFEVYEDDAGPVVRLCRPDLAVEVPGRLRLRAEAIELQARRGPVDVQATEDVVVRGEVIHLN